MQRIEDKVFLPNLLINSKLLVYLLVLMRLIIQGYIPVSYNWHTQQQDAAILFPFLETNLVMNLERH